MYNSYVYSEYQTKEHSSMVNFEMLKEQQDYI